MDQEKDNKKENKKIPTLAKIAIFIGADLLIFFLLFFLIRSCNSNTGNPQGGTEDNSEQEATTYRNALKHIANEQYKSAEGIVDSKDYISYISSYAINNNSFLFVAKTNLPSDNKYIGVNITNSSITSLDSAFTYISSNYTDLSSGDVTAEFYDECVTSTPSLDNAINNYVKGASKRIVDKLSVPNPDVVFFSISFMDWEDLVTAIGEYSVSYGSSELISASTNTTRVDSTKKSYIDIIEFK